MLANLILIICLLFAMLASWVYFNGSILVISLVLIGLMAVLVWNYADKAILYFLGAREIMSNDEPTFYKEATQQAYKLAVNNPGLYFYNGSFERAFVLQNGDNISLVLSRSLLERAGKDELAAICFALLLQVKKNMASSRTKGMLILCMSSWIVHGFGSILGKLIPFKHAKEVINLLANYFLHPWLRINFHLLIGTRYFKKLFQYLNHFPLENEQLAHFYLQLRYPDVVYSNLSRRLTELLSGQKSLHYQNILSLELLPHEWDYYQQHQEGLSDKEVARA